MIKSYKVMYVNYVNVGNMERMEIISYYKENFLKLVLLLLKV